jgi:hypothetical protein
MLSSNPCHAPHLGIYKEVRPDESMAEEPDTGVIAMNIDWKTLSVKAKGYVKSATEVATKAAIEVREHADRAAEAVAAKCTEVTGRETTAREVKRAVLIAAGTVALGTVALSLGASACSAADGAVAGAGSGGGGDGGWGSDFESRMARGFAENGGSLNYYTPRVDSCGTVYAGTQ